MPFPLKSDPGKNDPLRATIDPVPAVPADPAVEYGPKEWEEEAFALFAEGRDPQPCPKCGWMGFYGPRVSTDGVRFRECRLCGFYQGIGEAPAVAQPIVHACDAWPEIARAPYIWWVPPGQARFRCPFCDTDIDTADHRVPIPASDANHPWWRVPQKRTRFYYSRFWENWPFTKGRVFL
ncbi:MAG TPA: hypothetical protein VJ992_07045 [Gemmatimonadales bacterium]|nr:hypothetical protein [Gemmatimonadales bacterium]